MMDNQHPGQAPDFTNAAINMLGINLLWIFFVVWMLWGVLPVLMIALLINRFVEHVGDTRGITPIFGKLSLARMRAGGPEA
ncbi:hypothetical protein [Aestuariivita boseongensis]|uniref:hypothetical protein n=1 Tax=Aestuariivita boseongensis TaxID=1470562 RepID=UPI001C107BCB|nr:hypothetical protein [Aestuariivita boseongensis]